MTKKKFLFDAMKIKADDEKAATTDLGKQTIEGVVAQGTKITRTIPAGQGASSSAGLTSTGSGGACTGPSAATVSFEPGHT